MNERVNKDRLILAADVGGSKTLLQLYRINASGTRRELAQQLLQSNNYPSLEELTEQFIIESGEGNPDSACFAVAGPVKQRGERQTARLTNLPWQLDNIQLSEALGIGSVSLLNDFQAIGYSLHELANDELVLLHQGESDPNGTHLILGAGTGLGVSLLFPHPGGNISYPSEGGHLAFAPEDETEMALLQFLLQEQPRISYERILSGPGLVNIYRFLLQRDDIRNDPLLQEADPAAAIGQTGLYEENEIASEAITLFCRILGAFTGDLALATLPQGGIYIAGGIAPKLLPRLQDGSFVETYSAKGRMRELVRSFPVNVITNTRSGLLGAAIHATTL
jgi:glucokinase